VTRMHPLMVASATEDRHPAVIDTDHLRPSQISRFTAQEVPSEYDRKDSVLNPALVQYNYPAGPGGQTSVEFAINRPKVREAFAGDLSELQIALIGVTQRPIAAAAFSDASGRRPGRSCGPGRWSPPATRPSAPISPWLMPSGRAPTSSRSRARTSS
jgi:hypothetical protein